MWDSKRTVDAFALFLRPKKFAFCILVAWLAEPQIALAAVGRNRATKHAFPVDSLSTVTFRANVPSDAHLLDKACFAF